MLAICYEITEEEVLSFLLHSTDAAHGRPFCEQVYSALLYGAFGLALVNAIYLCFVAAPYGRHARRGYGRTNDNALSWLLMEAPAALMPLLWVTISGRFDAVTLIFLTIWRAHYFQRASFYPC